MIRKLASLEVPTGWLMLFNNFVHFGEGEAPAADDYELYLTQDILTVRQISPGAEGYFERSGALSIYLGWYPDGDPDGSYRLDLYRNGIDERIGFFEQRSTSIIRNALNLCLSLGAHHAEDSEIMDALGELS
ncbi:hypothetical protein ACIQ9D_10995 [Streptomyces anulatus]